MKHQKDKYHKDKKFLKVPSYPGGNKEFIKFIRENLKYPEEALKNKIEGTVYLEYTVDNIGTVAEVVVKHGIGFGCDEEALRLVRLLTYDPEKNRGVRMKTLMKTRIRFELPESEKPQPSINVTYVQPVTVQKENASQPSKPSSGYTITIQQ